MKFTQAFLPLVLAAGLLSQAQAQIDFAIAPNLARIDVFGLVAFFQRFDFFGLFNRFFFNGCRTLNSVENFDAIVFFSRPYFVQLVQPGEGFNREDELNCVVTDSFFRAGLQNGYTISLNNFAVSDGGDLIGAVDRSVEPPVVSAAEPLLCLVQTTTNPSKFISNVCFIPPLLGVDLWVVASEPDYIILTGGQPTVDRGDGFCSNDASGQNAGILIGTPETFPDPSVIDAALQRAMDLGLDTDVLLPVDQENSDGTPCTEFNTPRGDPFGVPPS